MFTEVGALTTLVLIVKLAGDSSRYGLTVFRSRKTERSKNEGRHDGPLQRFWMEFPKRRTAMEFPYCPLLPAALTKSPLHRDTVTIRIPRVGIASAKRLVRTAALARAQRF